MKKTQDKFSTLASMSSCFVFYRNNRHHRITIHSPGPLSFEESKNPSIVIVCAFLSHQKVCYITGRLRYNIYRSLVRVALADLVLHINTTVHSAVSWGHVFISYLTLPEYMFCTPDLHIAIYYSYPRKSFASSS